MNIGEKKAITVEKTNLSESLAIESLKNQTMLEEYNLIKAELKRLKENFDKLESKAFYNSSHFGLFQILSVSMLTITYLY